LAVVVTIAKGYDLSYIWKTQDHAAEPAAGGYYIDATQAGEPPGLWWGPGAQALGLNPGQAVERQPYDAVYRQIDPRTGARLGRARGRYPTFADHLARLTAAEPHATAERIIELEREAARATRQPAAYYDVTVSFSKSISILHASLRENERRARLATDQQAAAYWAGREQTFQEVLHRANQAALEYLQAWAGITRTGYHGTRVDGREPGRLEAGSRDIAAVLDARIRSRIDPLLPQPQGPWTWRVPELPDPDRHIYLAQIAVMMDDRTRRLGRHATLTSPAWAVSALGPVPADSAARRSWEQKAARIAAYREMYGYDHPDDPLGPEPGPEAPDQRAAWHEAFAVLGPAGQPDVRTMPDGRLWLVRDAYAAQTAWAPRHAGKPLRLSRLGAFDAALGALRADAEANAARKADDHDCAGRHETLAASYRALRDHYQRRERALAQAMADREVWDHATASARRLAIAADAELRRRHPRQRIEPLRSREPAPAGGAEHEQLDPAPDGKRAETAAWIHDLAIQREAFRAEIDNRPGLMAPGQDPVRGDLGETLPAWRASGRDPILQPPKPEIIPSARILQLAEPDYEAAD